MIHNASIHSIHIKPQSSIVYFISFQLLLFILIYMNDSFHLIQRNRGSDFRKANWYEHENINITIWTTIIVLFKLFTRCKPISNLSNTKCYFQPKKETMRKKMTKTKQVSKRCIWKNTDENKQINYKFWISLVMIIKNYFEIVG